MNKNKQVAILAVVIILITFTVFLLIKRNIISHQQDYSVVSSPIPESTVYLNQTNQSVATAKEVIPKMIFEVNSELETDSVQLPTGEWLSLSAGDYVIDYGHYYAFGNSAIKNDAKDLVRLEKMYSSLSSCAEKNIRCDHALRLSQIGNDKFSEKMYDLLVSELSNKEAQSNGYHQY